MLLALVLSPWAPLGGVAYWMALGPASGLAIVGASPGPGSPAILPRCLNYVLEELKNNAKAKVMVASHNEDTVRFTLCR